jgi:putative transposase
MRYSQYFNKKLKSCGHLWQGRFYSCVLDEPHLVAATRYIERNPVRAQFVEKPWQWEWSSASTHINLPHKGIIKLGDIFQMVDMPCAGWRDFIDTTDDLMEVDSIRKHTLTGRPLAGEQFTKKLEESFKRRLSALPRGRPRINRKEK